MLLKNTVFWSISFLLWRVEMNEVSYWRTEQLSPIASNHMLHIWQKCCDLPHWLQVSNQDARSSHFPKCHIFSCVTHVFHSAARAIHMDAHVFINVNNKNKSTTWAMSCKGTSLPLWCYAKGFFCPLFLHLGLSSLSNSQYQIATSKISSKHHHVPFKRGKEDNRSFNKK